MKILIDMNLSTQWTQIFLADGCDCAHWFSVGSPDATDEVIFQFASENGYVVFTQDLDFSAILAHTGANGPSVIQLRLVDSPPTSCAALVLSAIEAAKEELMSGAILTIDPIRSKVRVLPIGESQ